MKIKKNFCFQIGIALLISFLIGYPYYTNGYWFDDALNSQVKALLHLNGGELWEFSTRVVLHWLTHEGRLLFGFYYVYFLFNLFDNLELVRMAHFLAIIINISLFGYILSLYRVSFRFIAAWAIILIGSFQINGNGLDPVGGFAFHYPLLGIQLCTVLIFYIKWILSKGEKSLCLYSSLITWLVFMTCYEVNFIFIPMAALLLVRTENMKSRRKLSGFIFIAAATLTYLAISWFIRKQYGTGGYYGTQFGEFNRIVSVYLKQVTGSLPGISYALFLHSAVPLTSLLKQTVQNPICWMVFLSSSIFFYRNFSESISRNTMEQGVLIVSGCMVFLPAVFPSISLRYQNEVAWGCPTMPVYHQIFGMALIVTYLLFRLNKNILIRFILSLSIGTYLSLNLAMNAQMSNFLDYAWREPRDAFVKQVDHGLLKELNDGDVIQRKEGVPDYINSNLIFQYSGRRVVVVGDDYFWYPIKTNPNRTPSKYDLTRTTDATRTFQLTPHVD